MTEPVKCEELLKELTGAVERYSETHDKCIIKVPSPTVGQEYVEANRNLLEVLAEAQTALKLMEVK
ncbi:MAG: hypothetical protein KAR40_09585 [Candidatus Sabulitectum sp.]|nr:hypothetical protein [Candidatus Sabulitectum sp.]